MNETEKRLVKMFGYVNDFLDLNRQRQFVSDLQEILNGLNLDLPKQKAAPPVVPVPTDPTRPNQPVRPRQPNSVEIGSPVESTQTVPRNPNVGVPKCPECEPDPRRVRVDPLPFWMLTDPRTGEKIRTMEFREEDREIFDALMDIIIPNR